MAAAKDQIQTRATSRSWGGGLTRVVTPQKKLNASQECDLLHAKNPNLFCFPVLEKKIRENESKNEVQDSYAPLSYFFLYYSDFQPLAGS